MLCRNAGHDICHSILRGILLFQPKTCARLEAACSLDMFSMLLCTQTMIKPSSSATSLVTNAHNCTDPAISQCKAKPYSYQPIGMVKEKKIGKVFHFNPKPSLSSTAPQSLASKTFGLG